MDEDQIILVQETEYTGAGKTVQPQLSFARENGIDIHFGNPRDEKPGVTIVLPDSPKAIEIKDVDLNRLKRSAVKNATKGIERELTAEEFDYLAEEINDSVEKVKSLLEELKN
ncbi:MAG: PLP-dependent lyase/thiolase, partial [Vagococcus sp.]